MAVWFVQRKVDRSFGGRRRVCERVHYGARQRFADARGAAVCGGARRFGHAGNRYDGGCVHAGRGGKVCGVAFAECGVRGFGRLQWPRRPKMSVREIKMPDLSTTGSEVTLLRWLVPVGGHVERGQVLLEVETDKAITEVEAT